MQCGGPRPLWVLRVCREWPVLPSLVLTHFCRAGISSGGTQEGVTCLRVWGPQGCPCLVRTEDGKLTVHPVFVCKKKKAKTKTNMKTIQQKLCGCGLQSLKYSAWSSQRVICVNLLPSFTQCSCTSESIVPAPKECVFDFRVTAER